MCLALFIYVQINADCVGALLVFSNIDEIKILALTRLLPFRIVCIRNERLAPLIFRQRFKKIDDLALIYSDTSRSEFTADLHRVIPSEVEEPCREAYR